MIDFIKGEVEEIGLDYVVISSNGIGYFVNTSTNSIVDFSINSIETVFVRMVVREDDISLVGFSKKEEREMYMLLTSVSKIGMRIALSILSTYHVNDIAYFISISDISSLSKIPGIGTKTAERMVLELKDKIKPFLRDDYTPEAVSVKDINSSKRNILDDENDAISALISLGFSKDESHKAVETVKNIEKGKISSSQLIKLALSQLGR